jgi:hypothetical protein
MIVEAAAVKPNIEMLSEPLASARREPRMAVDSGEIH